MRNNFRTLKERLEALKDVCEGFDSDWEFEIQRNQSSGSSVDHKFVENLTLEGKESTTGPGAEDKLEPQNSDSEFKLTTPEPSPEENTQEIDEESVVLSKKSKEAMESPSIENPTKKQKIDELLFDKSEEPKLEEAKKTLPIESTSNQSKPEVPENVNKENTNQNKPKKCETEPNDDDILKSEPLPEIEHVKPLVKEISPEEGDKPDVSVTLDKKEDKQPVQSEKPKEVELRVKSTPGPRIGKIKSVFLEQNNYQSATKDYNPRPVSKLKSNFMEDLNQKLSPQKSPITSPLTKSYKTELTQTGSSVLQSTKKSWENSQPPVFDIAKSSSTTSSIKSKVMMFANMPLMGGPRPVKKAQPSFAKPYLDTDKSAQILTGPSPDEVKPPTPEYPIDPYYSRLAIKRPKNRTTPSDKIFQQ